MQLTDFQKKIIDTIIIGQTCHIETFFEKYCSVAYKEHINAVWETYLGRQIMPSLKGNIVTLVPNPYDAHNRLKEFISLWQDLEREHLIKVIPYHKALLYPAYSVEFQPLRQLIVLFYAYDQKEIVPSPGLTEFVKDDYRTREEIRQEEERRILHDEVADRRTSQKLTVWIAIISIVTSLASAGAAIYFNYLTFTTDRTVTIANPTAFPDTTNVYLLNPSRNVPDTTIKGPKP